MNNKFITVEGLDGSGKTTIVAKIIRYLHDRGIDNVITIHEPGGTPIANSLSMLIKYGLNHEPINSISETLMIYAARIQLIENVIKPALLKGYWVIGDRHELSSQAYQGGGRKVNKLLLHVLTKNITSLLSPRLTLYLDVTPEVGLSRIKNRGKLDRIEQESLSFFIQVRNYYQKLAILDKNIVTIDANQTVTEVSFAVYQNLDKWLLLDFTE